MGAHTPYVRTMFTRHMLYSNNFVTSAALAEVSTWLTLSLRFTGHFPDEPGLAGIY